MILALDFSTERRSAALVAEGRLVASAAETGGRSTRAFSLITKLLRDAKSDRDDIDCLAVGLGPGSYAGIRVSIAMAQGWQLARGIRLRGVPTGDVLAAQAQAAGHRGPLHVVIDAQRNEFYLASFALTNEAVELTEPMRILSLAAVQDQLSQGGVLVGDPALEKLFPKLEALWPEASMLGQLAGRRATDIDGAALEPVYLRETTFVKAPPPRQLPPMP